MRSRALGQAWTDRGGQTVFISTLKTPALIQEIQNDGCEFVQLNRFHPDPDDLNVTCRIAQKYPGAWIVLDGYHFDRIYQQTVTAFGNRVLVLDDMNHQPFYHTHMLLNQNPYADTLPYHCHNNTRLLAGLDYVLLRKEFRQWKDWERVISSRAEKLLVTLGGGDATETALIILHALAALPAAANLGVRLLAGGSNSRYHELEQAVEQLGLNQVNVCRHTKDMPAWIAWADLAVTAAGSTMWEMAFMGLPVLTVIRADNQCRIAESAAEKGIAWNLGWHDDLCPRDVTGVLEQLVPEVSLRRRMSESGKKLVDGNGAARVIDALLSYEGDIA